MKKKTILICAAASAALILAAGIFLVLKGTSGVTRIRVIETTDIHGYFTKTIGTSAPKVQYSLAYIAGKASEERASGDNDDVLLIDGGDLYQGPSETTMSYGAPIRAIYDAMGYDAVMLGNHEFDWGIEKTTQEDGTLPPYDICSYKGDPAIPVLGCNLYEKATGERVNFTKDYVITEKAGRRIALIGYLPNYIPGRESKYNDPYYIDDDLTKFGKRIEEIVQKEEPDVTIVMTHADPVDVAPSLDPSVVDLVAGGHTHRVAYGKAGNGIPYIQADHDGSGYATATIVIDNDGNVTVEDLMFNPIDRKKELLYDTPENEENFDPSILKISRDVLNDYSEKMNEVLGYSSVPIDKNDVTGDNGSTVAGNFVTGLMLRATQGQNTVAAFYNNGSIMKNFHINKGEDKVEITGKDIYDLFKFNNRWLIFEISGAELKEHLARSLKDPNLGDQMSGLTFEYRTEPEIEILSITLFNGTRVDLNDTKTLYRVCISDYAASRKGSIFEGKDPVVPVDEAPVDNVTAIRLLREEGKDCDGLILVDQDVRGINVG